MLLIPHLLARTEQPQDGARIDAAHPLLAGRTVSAFLPAISAANLARGPGILGSHVAPTVALPLSMLASSITATNLRLTSDRAFQPTPAYPLTMIWVGKQGSTVNTQLAGITSASGISGSYSYIGGGSSTIITYAARNNFGSALAMTATVPGGSALGVEMVIVAQSLSASDHRLCVNGSAVATATTNIGAMVAWDRVFFGQASSANNQQSAALIVASGGVGLTDEQMQQLSRDPREVYALFEPQRIWVPVASAAGGDGTASGATLTASASLVHGSASGEANATASGTTAAAAVSLIAGAASGQINATAPAATLTASASITAGSATGTISASASGATITAAASLVPGSASGASAGTASGVTLTAACSLVAGSASGASAGTAAGQTITAAASLITGSATGQVNATASGVVLTAAAVVVAGAASAANDATATGATLTVVASITAGSASGGTGVQDATAAGATMTATLQLVAGGAYGPSLASTPGFRAVGPRPMFTARIGADGRTLPRRRAS